MTIKQLGGIFGRDPTFNDVEIEGTLTVSNATLDNLTIDNAGTIQLTKNTSAQGDSLGIIEFHDEDGAAGADAGKFQLQAFRGADKDAPTFKLIGSDSVGTLTDRVEIGSAGDVTVSTGNLVIGTSGKGIDFSATSGTGTSELFDDYEEGTWTPTFGITGGSFSSITYNAFTGGTYTKIGNVVHVSGYITTNSAVVAVDGGLTIEGLPFATGSGTGLSTRSAVTIGEALAFGTNYPTAGRFQAGTSRIYVTERSSANGASTFLQASNMGNTTVDNQISFSGFYMT